MTHSTNNTLRVAIVGGGPSGFYAAQALLRSGRHVTVDVLDRLPVPYGLVRYGVAPDHQKLKTVTKVFERIGLMHGFNFRGNVTVGRDIGVPELFRTHHAVLLAYGASADRRMGITGEQLPGSLAATEVVGWYNGHPDYRGLEIDTETSTAVVVGHGNVAIDVARMLAMPPAELARTDIATHALQALKRSRIRKIYVIGRRGPLQSRMSPKELRELSQINGCSVAVSAEECVLDVQCVAELKDPHSELARQRMQLYRSFAQPPGGRRERNVEIRFLSSPVSILGCGRVQAIEFERNLLVGNRFERQAVGTGGRYRLSAGLVVRSIGYRGRPICDDIPFDRERGVVPNQGGRVMYQAEPVRGLYCAGWIARGPRGLIGDSRDDGIQTARNLLADFPESIPVESKPGVAELDRILTTRRVRTIDFEAWGRIDRNEELRGQLCGKPREKFTRTEEMLWHSDARQGTSAVVGNQELPGLK